MICSGWAVAVVKWSACSTSTPTIRVRILLTSKVLSVKFVFEKNENKQKMICSGTRRIKNKFKGP